MTSTLSKKEATARHELREVLVQLALLPEDADKLMIAIDVLMEAKLARAMDGVVRGGMPYFGQ